VYRRAKRPLNPDAVAAADRAIAAETGGRSLTLGPSDAALRKKWMDAYIAAGGQCEPVKKGGKKPGDSTQPCPGKREQQEQAIAEYNAAMAQKATESAKFFLGHQRNKDTCALMSAYSVVYETTGNSQPPVAQLTFFQTLENFWAGLNMKSQTPKTEKEMIAVGQASGGYTWCNGTTDESAIMTKAGIPAVNTDNPSLEDIARAVEDGKAVVVGYDTRPVWGGRWLLRDQPAGHAVRVTAVQRDEDGNITGFYVNDSGNGEAPEYIPAATFQQALDGLDGGRMSVSQEALFTPQPTPTGGI